MSPASSLLLPFLLAIGTVSCQFFAHQGLGILPGAGPYGSYGARTGRLAYGPQYGGPSQHLGLYGGGGGGSRLGPGYIGNGGIGIKQTDANLADLYGLPRQLAQAPPPQPLQVPQMPQLPQMPQYPYLGSPYGQIPSSPYGPSGLYNAGPLNYGRGYLG